MNAFVNIFRVELHKAGRSRVPWMTALGFLIMPLASAFFMFIYRDPEFARKAGLISAKANLMVGTADWPGYLGMLAQATAIGGIFFFGLVCSWVFGREFADGTLKDLLAVPVARSSILLAKFAVVGLWCVLLTLEVLVLGLVMGVIIRLPAEALGLIFHDSLRLVVSAAMVAAVILPFALFASLGRGYLLPMGCAMLALVLANVLATVGWGPIFPWSVPGLYATLDSQSSGLTPVSYALVVLTGLAGMLVTGLWWNMADQNR